jgi:serine/threonine protein kinase
MFGNFLGRGKQPPPPPQPQEPALVPGYQLGELLGRGRLGEVYAAVLLRSGRPLAIKLKHPNLVKVLDLGEANDGRPYMVLERVHGETLNGKGPLPGARVAEVIVAAAAALRAMHDKRFLLLDVKPHNSPKITKTNLVTGTPAYMAPEQAQGEPNARSDQYSLDMVACELLTGSLPTEGRCPALSSEAATAVLQRMIAPRFEKRFAGPEEAARALADALA